MTARVVIVSRIFLPEVAAASFRLAAVSDALAQKGVQVQVLTTRPGADKRTDLADSSNSRLVPGGAHLVSHSDEQDARLSRNLSDGQRPIYHTDQLLPLPVKMQESTQSQPAGKPSRQTDLQARAQADMQIGPKNGVADISPDITVSRWPAWRDRNGYIRGYLQYLSFDVPVAFRLLFCRRPVAVLCEPPPTTGAITRVICALRRVPYTYYGADVWSDAAASSAPAMVVRILRFIERFALSGAAQVIAVNDGVAQRLQALGARQVQIVENGIDTEIFSPTGPTPDPEELAHLGITGPYFLYAGTASEWQGAGIFVQALALVRKKYPHVQLLYLGQGSNWEEIQALADRHPNSVIMHPLLPPAQAARYQRGAVAAVVSIKPGQGYDFAYPTKIFAALACDTPVIFAGNGPAAADIARYRLGEVSADFTAQAVANAMEAALTAGTDKYTDLSAWVQENRSMRRTGRQGAEVVIQGARSYGASERNKTNQRPRR